MKQVQKGPPRSPLINLVSLGFTNHSELRWRCRVPAAPRLLLKLLQNPNSWRFRGKNFSALIVSASAITI